MKRRHSRGCIDPRIVVLGASLGGVEAVDIILPSLPKDYPFPLVVVLHRHRDSGDVLVEHLRKACSIPVMEAEDKMPIETGWIYLAPPDYHLLIERECAVAEDLSVHHPALHFVLSTDEEVNHARPSIDVLFESVAEACGSSVVGIILTGASRDGASGLVKIKARGGFTVAQDPDSAKAAIMPLAAIAETKVDRVMKPEEIGRFLLGLGEKMGLLHRNPERGTRSVVNEEGKSQNPCR
jgi:two-component system chemotaxis response regulator CheB